MNSRIEPVDTAQFRAEEAGETFAVKSGVDFETRSTKFSAQSGTPYICQPTEDAHTWTSFSPKSTLFTSWRRAILSGFGS